MPCWDRGIRAVLHTIKPHIHKHTQYKVKVWCVPENTGGTDMTDGQCDSVKVQLMANTFNNMSFEKQLLIKAVE